MYDMATDSAGNIHLVASGRIEESSEEINIFHLVWDGEAWTGPYRISDTERWSMYPRIAISDGNNLHMVWFDKLGTDFGFSQEGPRSVWYSHSQSSAPPQTPLPPNLPATATAPVTATPISMLPATPYPTAQLAEVDVSRMLGDLETENDELMQIALGLALVGALIGVVVAIRQRMRGR
jgi:hypothetical protein